MRHKSPIDLFLQPGEYFVGNADYRVRTLLGSCVSITLWHPESRIGAMSHFLLSARGAGVSSALDARYGEEALSLMLHELEQAGVPAIACQAKIFGGGNMFPRQTKNDALHIGRKNGETARRLLRFHGIDVVSESLYGIGHRQIIFDIGSGDVWVRQVKPAEVDTPAVRKRA